MSKNPKKNAQQILFQLCSIGVYLYLVFLVVIYAFYFREGYTQIATRKFELLRSTSLKFGVVLIPLAIAYAIAWYLHRRQAAGHGKNAGRGQAAGHGQAVAAAAKTDLRAVLSVTDAFVVLYAVVVGISWLAGDDRADTLWGAEGWYMGLGTQLICVAIYFLVSRFVVQKVDVLPYLLQVSFLLFLWGHLNRFSIYPVQMAFQAPQFISTMGNVNWFSGYWSVFFATGVVLYWITEKKDIKHQIFYGIYTAEAVGFGIVEGSDSAYISLLVVFLLLFLLSFQKVLRMERFLELLLITSAACQGMRLITVLAPQALNMTDPLSSFCLGNSTLLLFLLAALLRFLLSKKGDASPVPFSFLRILVPALLGAAAVIYVVLLARNTINRGSIGALSGSQAFLFDQSWGNGRMGAWRDGLMIFASLPFWKKLIGAGPDAFYFYGSAHQQINALMEAQFSGSRLTNAHNECITILANLGLLGLTGFLGMVWTGTMRCLKKAAEEPVLVLFAACILSYFWHNMFSFEQVENLPYFYLMLGLAENRLRQQKTA